jgi:alkylation response protein AidB-like acyl-CoA dehydrogenase
VVDVSAGVAEVLVQTGRAELVERYAAPMAAGTFVCPPAAYESRDPFEYRTTAREVAGGWRLDGCKPFVGGALFADAFLVYAREEESGDILGFVVERGDEGVCVDRLATTGLRSMGFGTVSMDRVRLAKERLVVDVDAVSAFNTYLRNRRLMTACSVVGHMRALIDACVLVLDGRQRGGLSVLEYPNVQRTVGEMFTALHTSRAIVHRALASTYGARDRFFDPVSTVAKAFVSEQAIKVGLTVMGLQGGEGYMRQHPWERSVRDALALIGGQGAQELLLIQLGQHMALETRQREVRRLRAGPTRDGACIAFGEILVDRLARLLDGLDDRLHRPGARVLDAGTGPAGVAVELRRRLPLAQVVAVELRAGGALEGVDRFDLAWAAPEPLCLHAVLRSLTVGGWAVAAAWSGPGADELARAMEEAGFGSIRVVPEPSGGTLHLVAGRRTR